MTHALAAAAKNIRSAVVIKYLQKNTMNILHRVFVYTPIFPLASLEAPTYFAAGLPFTKTKV